MNKSKKNKKQLYQCQCFFLWIMYFTCVTLFKWWNCVPKWIDVYLNCYLLEYCVCSKQLRQSCGCFPFFWNSSSLKRVPGKLLKTFWSELILSLVIICGCSLKFIYCTEHRMTSLYEVKLIFYGSSS